MNVLIIAHSAIREANRPVYRRLAERGHTVTLLIPHRWKSVLGGRLDPEPEPAGSPLRVVVRRRIGKSHTSLFFFPQGFDDLLSRDGVTAMYVDQDAAGFCAYQAARTVSRRKAGMIITSMQNILKRYPPPFESIQRYVFEKASVAHAFSRECEETIKARGFKGPVDIFSFGYELEVPSEEQRRKIRERYKFTAPSVGYVGRLVEDKAVDTFLRALALVDGVTGVVGGDGPLAASLRALCVELGIAERVVFTGNLSPNEAVELIGALDVCVLPSRTRPNWKEQVGRVLIEAMAQRVVVVGSSSGEIPATMGDAGIVFPEDDVEAMAAALRQALDPARRPELLDRGVERVAKKFSIDAATDVLEQALRRSVEHLAAS